MKIIIAADHGGFALKTKLIDYLKTQVIDLLDLGAAHLDSADDYPPYAFAVAETVVAAGGDNNQVFGILICRSGIGMSIAANKVDGAYAALCLTAAHAHKAREHNDANVLVLDADYEHETPEAIIAEFLHTQFGGERHERRVEQIKQYELRKSAEPLG
jgi:RpiB/LacA/LacB family sugar-phosphate isomerase